MRQRAYIVAVLAIGLLAVTGRPVTSYCRMVASAIKVRQSFNDLKQADNMGPIQRFVFSLVLARSTPPKANM